MSSRFGKAISREEGSAYFTRYIRLRNRHGEALKKYFEGDPEASRFYAGRIKVQDPVLEDVVFVFDADSVKRLLEQIQSGSFDSLMVFMGTHDEVDLAQDESSGRPTVLLFPARKEAKEGKFQYTLSLMGEEHPGSGVSGGRGGGGTGLKGIVVETVNGQVESKIPDVLHEDGFHSFM
jgi:hypothetical protein